MCKILLVDDHAVVGAGLKSFLNSAGGFSIAGEARTGVEALELLAKKSWDLLLLDIGLPDMNGLEVLKRVRAKHPKLPVLVFSMHSEDEYAMTALDAGAVGYLPKDSPPEEILVAIRRASAGERYVSPSLARKLLDGVASAPRKLPHDHLSVRELEVMYKIGAGVPLTEIAQILHLSPKTVTTYRSRILEKLGLRNNAEVTRYVLKHGLGE